MYSLVILPEKTQLGVGKEHKKYVGISLLQEYPSIFLPLVHKDRSFLAEFFGQLALDLQIAKDKPKDKLINIVLAQDLFEINQVNDHRSEAKIYAETDEEMVGCQCSMAAYGDGNGWYYGLRKDILQVLKEEIKSAGFTINYIKTATEVMFYAIRDLNSETFILSFAREDLEVDFINGLTGVNKFALPLTSFPKLYKNWQMKDVKEELNLHSKAKDTVFSHKLTANLNTCQRVYVANNNELALAHGVNNGELITSLMAKKLLKSDFVIEEMAQYLLVVGAFLAAVPKLVKDLELPPGFTIHQLNFNDDLVEDNKAQAKPQHSSPVRRFCKGVSLIMLFLLFFMGASLYYFNGIKTPSNVEMTKYHEMMAENEKLAKEQIFYEKLTGDKAYFNLIWKNLYLGEFGHGEYSQLHLKDFKMDLLAKGENKIILTISSSSEGEGDKYLAQLKKQRYFSKVTLLDKEKVIDEGVDEETGEVKDNPSQVLKIELKLPAFNKDQEVKD